jgi:hypothetical protein
VALPLVATVPPRLPTTDQQPMLVAQVRTTRERTPCPLHLPTAATVHRNAAQIYASRVYLAHSRVLSDSDSLLTGSLRVPSGLLACVVWRAPGFASDLLAGSPSLEAAAIVQNVGAAASMTASAFALVVLQRSGSSGGYVSTSTRDHFRGTSSSPVDGAITLIQAGASIAPRKP